jgi:cobalt/nickel transport system permease protein
LHEAAAEGRSLLHQLDPRAKLVATLFLILPVALAHTWAAPALLLILGLALVVTARLGLGLFLRRAWVVNLFVIFMWVFLPWQVEWPREGQALAMVYNPAGLDLAFLVTLKVNAIFALVLALLGTSRINEILHALAHLHVPAKLVTLFLLFHRYLFVIYQEYHRLTQAMKVRCFRPRTNAHTYRTYANLVGMLLVRSFDRSERVYQAMLCRGFKGAFWLLDHFAWQRRDTVFCVCTGLATALLFFLDWGIAPWS